MFMFVRLHFTVKAVKKILVVTNNLKGSYACYYHKKKIRF